MQYLLEVFVDSFIAISIPRSQEDLRHVANVVMHGIHDVFLAVKDDTKDPMFLKKILKREAHGQ